MRFDRIRFTQQGEERFAEVQAFLDDLGHQGHELAAEVRSEFEKRLGYLDDFGGPVGDEDPRRRFLVTLGRDFAPLSFTVTWEQLDLRTGEYRFAFNGGLIWHGGGNDPLTVALTPCFWGIHT